MSLAMDSGLLPGNPLYRAWKSKSFTGNDLMLHFFFLDLFRDGALYTAEETADRILEEYHAVFDSQLVRKKANEYVKEGILSCKKSGKKLYYQLMPELRTALPGLWPKLLSMVMFFQLAAPLGFIGSTILDNQKIKNKIFLVKHGYFGFTLEDEVLFSLLQAMQAHRLVTILNQSRKTGREQEITAAPLKIFVSTRTGRRFLCLYHPRRRRFSTLRIDQIRKVTAGELFPEYSAYQEKLSRNLKHCFGISFGQEHGMDQVRMTLRIREGSEDYILTRLQREGRGGTVTRVEKNTYLYEIQVFDGLEMLPWIRTFTGRILSLESNNDLLCRRFRRDLHTMARMYQDT